MKEIEEFLISVNVNPTPVRILVYKTLKSSSFPMSLADIEESLESVDKSSISRTLSTFRNHDLIHSFNDGSGSMKYEICHDRSGHTHDDLHVHFRCEICGKTICLTSIKVPPVKLPKGFKAKETNYLIQGTCANCDI